MTTSESIGQLAAALAKASGSFGPVKKDKTAITNTYTYNYADLASTLESARPALAQNGLALIQLIGLTDLGFGCTTRLAHSSGEFIETFYPFQPLPDIQKTGSLITYIRRYTASAMLGIAAEEDDDGNAAKDEAEKQARSEKKQPANGGNKPKPAQGGQAQQAQPKADEEWKRARKHLIELFDKDHLSYPPDLASTFLNSVVGKTQTKDLTLEEMLKCISTAEQAWNDMRSLDEANQAHASAEKPAPAPEGE